MALIITDDNKVFEYSETKIIDKPIEIFDESFKMTPKERLMKAKSLIMVDKTTNKVLSTYNLIHQQHYYPLSILDYANAMKNFLLKKIQSLPILSLDSHDFSFCDFNCKDCLAVDTREWAKDKLGFTSFEPEHYEKVLTEIARYSKARGCDSVRFEMSGEGNPDMYPHRARIIRFARQKCNMKIVYITTGSKLNEDTINALAENADYIRISLPGVTEKAYELYSNQYAHPSHRYTLEKSMELIKKLVDKRKEFNRDGELLIGARTCFRPENEGGYLTVAKKLKEIGADSFQVVKIVIPDGENVKDYPITEATKKEIEILKNLPKEERLLNVQIPNKLDYIYYARELDKDEKPSQCFSSLVSPILYGPHLVICTHWEKIKDVEFSHYGKINGEQNELEDLMHNAHAKEIREKVPKKCNDCCSIFDNLVLESIKAQLSLAKNIEDIEFYLSY